MKIVLLRNTLHIPSHVLPIKTLQNLAAFTRNESDEKLRLSQPETLFSINRYIC